MIPNPPLRALLRDFGHWEAVPWQDLLEQFGEACAPFAGVCPLDDDPWSRWQRQIGAEALTHLATLQEVAGWDLPHLLVKGLAWGERLWGDLSCRPAHDVDLVVRAHDLAAWTQSLVTAGFKTSRSPLAWRRGRQILQLHHDGPSPHWLHRVPFPWRDAWSRCVVRPLGPLQVAQLDTADELLYLAHHQVFRHGFDHDLGWLDLAGWCRLPDAEVALPAARERAADSHLAPSLAALAWAWAQHWGQTGLGSGSATGVVRLLHGYLERRPSDPWGQAALTLMLSTPGERRTLLAGGWEAWRRWRRSALV